jgi:hypothetical protein
MKLLIRFTELTRVNLLSSFPYLGSTNHPPQRIVIRNLQSAYQRNDFRLTYLAGDPIERHQIASNELPWFLGKSRSFAGELSFTELASVLSTDISKKFRSGLNAGNEQPVACASASDIEQVAFGIVNFIEFRFVSDGLDALLQR